MVNKWSINVLSCLIVFMYMYIYIYILENGETIREKSGNLFHQIEWAPWPRLDSQGSGETCRTQVGVRHAQVRLALVRLLGLRSDSRGSGKTRRVLTRKVSRRGSTPPPTSHLGGGLRPNPTHPPPEYF